MRKWKLSILCSHTNFQKWRINATIYTLAAVILAFAVWNLTWVGQFCRAAHLRITPWVAPFLFSITSMLVVYGCIVSLLFHDAPFADAHMPFLMIRTGKKAWIKGQLLYIYAASLVLTLFDYAVSLLVLLPQMGWSWEWGTVITALAKDIRLASRYGVKVSGMVFDPNIVGRFSPLTATLLSLLLMWLVAVFLGTMIMAFNIVAGKGSGVVAAGILIFLSYFSGSWGFINYGLRLYYFSPVSWVTLSCLNPSRGLPGLPFAIGVLTFAIVLFSAVSVVVFCRKDTDIQKGAQ